MLNSSRKVIGSIWSSYGLESIPANNHTEKDNKQYQQQFNHVGDYLDSIRVRAKSSIVHITTKAISMTLFK